MPQKAVPACPSLSSWQPAGSFQPDCIKLMKQGPITQTEFSQQLAVCGQGPNDSSEQQQVLFVSVAAFVNS